MMLSSYLLSVLRDVTNERLCRTMNNRKVLHEMRAMQHVSSIIKGKAGKKQSRSMQVQTMPTPEYNSTT